MEKLWFIKTHTCFITFNIRYKTAWPVDCVSIKGATVSAAGEYCGWRLVLEEQTKSPWIIIAPKADRAVPSSGPSSHWLSSSSQNSLVFKKEAPFLPPIARIFGRSRPTGSKVKKLLGLDISCPLPRAFVSFHKISTLHYVQFVKYIFPRNRTTSN